MEDFVTRSHDFWHLGLAILSTAKTVLVPAPQLGEQNKKEETEVFIKASK